MESVPNAQTSTSVKCSGISLRSTLKLVTSVSTRADSKLCLDLKLQSVVW